MPRGFQGAETAGCTQVAIPVHHPLLYRKGNMKLPVLSEGVPCLRGIRRRTLTALGDIFYYLFLILLDFLKLNFSRSAESA